MNPFHNRGQNGIFRLNLGETVHCLSIYKRERKSERCDREARGVPTPYLVKSSVLRWLPVLPRFAPGLSRIQRSNKNTRKQRALNSLKATLHGQTLTPLC